MSTLPGPAGAETLEERVNRLLARWREETAFLSSSSAMVAHPAYQELIALGSAALPYLFRDLERTGDGHLSRALTELTGANPVLPEERGRIRAIADRWLNWAREHGHRW